MKGKISNLIQKFNNLEKSKKILLVIIFVLIVIAGITCIVTMNKQNEEQIEEVIEEEEITVDVTYELYEEESYETVTITANKEITKIELKEAVEESEEVATEEQSEETDETVEEYTYTEETDWTLSDDGLELTKDFQANIDNVYRLTFETEETIEVNVIIDDFEEVLLEVDTEEQSSNVTVVDNTTSSDTSSSDNTTSSSGSTSSGSTSSGSTSSSSSSSGTTSSSGSTTSGSTSSGSTSSSSSSDSTTAGTPLTEAYRVRRTDLEAEAVSVWNSYFLQNNYDTLWGATARSATSSEISSVKSNGTHGTFKTALYTQRYYEGTIMGTVIIYVEDIYYYDSTGNNTYVFDTWIYTYIK